MPRFLSAVIANRLSGFRFLHVAVVAALACHLTVPAIAQIGALDPNFNPLAILQNSTAGTVNALAATTDGKVIAAGNFTSVAGTARGRIARFLPDGSLDGTFATGAGANAPILALARDSAGNILIGGEFTSYNGTPRNRIARLDANGSLDTTFNPGTGFDAPVRALAVTGLLIYAGGDFLTCNGTARNRLAVLGPDGVLDPYRDSNGGANGTVRALLYDESTDTVHVGGDFTSFGGSPRNYHAMLRSYSATVGGSDLNLNGPVRALAATGSGTSTGRIYLGGDFTTVSGIPRGRLACFKSSYGGGAPVLDTSFDYWLGASCHTILGGTTGNRILVGGDFTTVNGQPKSRLASIFATVTNYGPYSVETWSMHSTYGTVGPDGPVFALQTGAGAKPLLGGAFSSFGGVARSALVRIHGEDAGAAPAAPTSPTATVLSSSQIHLSWTGSAIATGYTVERSTDGGSSWTPVQSGAASSFTDSGLAAGSTFTYRITASNSNGSGPPSSSIQATTAATPWTGSGTVLSTFPADFVNGQVSAIHRQADGRILICGSFQKVQGVTRKYIARLLPDLTLDPAFDPGTSANSPITAIEPGPQGSIYIFGSFSSVAGAVRHDVARLLPGGALDPSFDTGFEWTFSYGIRSQSDGKLIVYGNFDSFFDAPRNSIARLNLDGSVDTSFDCEPNSIVDAVAIQPDGKILLGGWFSSINGTERSYLARIHPDGSVDSSFTASSSGVSIKSIHTLPSGKHYLAGSFTTINGTPRKYLARLVKSGAIDSTFDPGTSSNISEPLIFPQPDGRLIIAGGFTSFAATPRWKLARLNANGGIDATFQAEAGPASGSITSVLALPDGTLLVGGSFTSFGATSSAYLVNLKAEFYTQPPAVPPVLSGEVLSSTRVQLAWSEVPGAYTWKLERSQNAGATWQPVAALPWQSGTFTDQGLTPGTSYLYRLFASNSAGDSPSSALLSLQTLQPFQQWKLDAGLTIQQPDSSDTDGDGISLLLEYALGLDPHTAQSSAVLTPQLIGGFLTIAYPTPRPDVTYLVESSTDLISWSSDSVYQGIGGFPIAWTPTAGFPRKYLRLRVSIP